ncbi:OLC1v1038456C1 [Oldenlandia corymbosa var. corymbosa]|uniref:OLC1v1038456C1 n=1 Tax=Oldenlandia corymbosa var. corymbosa TaxID=529605 RepID=A0AAV1CZV0_OLDCO|nr:OLC1v1038456C1 [Oldenlandia corymbosa var. corymbosa]
MLPIYEMFDLLERTLIEWKDYVNQEKSKRSRRKLAGQIFEPNEYGELLDSLTEKINQLGLDWFFLQMVWQWMTECKGTTSMFLRDERLFTEKVGDPGNLIFNDLRSCYFRATRDGLLEWSQKTFTLLDDCKRKTDGLIGIREAVKDISTKSASAAYSPAGGFRLFFNDYVRTNMWIFNDAGDGVLDKKLVSIYSELISIYTYLELLEKCQWNDGSSVQELAVPVTMRIAIQFCNLWFNRNDPETASVIAREVESLLQEIDPCTNLEFLQLNLRCLMSTYQSSFQQIGWNGCDLLIKDFCCYLCNWFHRKNLDLASLVTVFIDISVNEGEKDLHNLSAEIKALLAEAAFLHRKVQRDLAIDYLKASHSSIKWNIAERKEREVAAALAPCSELQANVCLLKAELFLKQRLNARASSTLFSDDRFYKVDMVLADLRALKRQVCDEQGNTEYVKRSLVVAEELANEIESLQKSLHSKTVTNPLCRRSLQQSLFRIVFFKAESILAELLRIGGDTSLGNEMHKVGYLVEELKHFKGFVATKLSSNPSDDELVLLQIEVVTREITLLSYSYLPNHKKFEKIVNSLPQLLDKVRTLKAKLSET